MRCQRGSAPSGRRRRAPAMSRKRGDSGTEGRPAAGELAGTDLAGSELAGTDLAGSDLAGTDLAGTRFCRVARRMAADFLPVGGRDS
ncbi:pentapeptide repeat-containing protein [Bosea sp. LC85]|uniref:pentapeptide repeat-containing protein n=1 Tax=Bosea sp. LC85 TaxID=1502851 RepID=UPI0009DD8248